MRLTVLVGLFATLALAGPAPAGTKVELKNVHMCCGGCAKEAKAVLTKVEGVTDVECDEEKTTARFAAADARAAQRALDALAAAGFHGDTGGSKEYAFKDDSGAKDVPGVAGDTAKSKVRTCDVTGDFDPVALVRALNKAGFHVKVKE
jgi:copper chaperone CopZ